ncbi:hypothetical protein ABN034_24220 [Actinopolymorpha sp. B11F2]|uniref:hypothetical protein n=1 Tax=Actinopolymorpha sp. B11F2 TaxID=3160862 RepID=UPI0032E4E45A
MAAGFDALLVVEQTQVRLVDEATGMYFHAGMADLSAFADEGLPTCALPPGTDRGVATVRTAHHMTDTLITARKVARREGNR